MKKDTLIREEVLFDQCLEERLNQLKQYGLKIFHNKFEFKLLYNGQQEKSQRINKFRKLLEHNFCLAIYTSKGFIVSKVQSFEIMPDDYDPAVFNTSSNSFDSLLDGYWYYLAIYRNATDYAYRKAFSKSEKYFIQPEFYKSRDLLAYIKGQSKNIQLDQTFDFRNHHDLWNQIQQNTIGKAKNSMNMIIEGPAGVGKSLVGCKIAIQFLLNKKKVVMVAVTNIGAKAICQHMVKQLSTLPVFKKNSILGLHQSFLNYLKAILKAKISLNNFPKNRDFMIDWLDMQIKKIVRQLEQIPNKVNFLYFNLLVPFEEYFILQSYLRFYSFNTQIIISLIRINQNIPVLDILNNLNKLANKLKVPDQFRDDYWRAVRMTIHRADLVITNTSRSIEINRHQEPHQLFKPYVAIFDEAAQATLSDTYCILSLDIKRLILIGDEKQLAPVHKTALTIKKTLFSILKNSPNNNYNALQRQYRMHPEIAKLVNHLTYKGQLKNGFKMNDYRKRQLSNMLDIKANPIFMISHDEYQQSPTSINQHGYLNMQQIRIIKMYIDAFTDEELQNVGIVTVYKAQERMMREKFKDQIKLGLSVKTVDGYQGAEKDYIFFSVVRANENGYMGNSEDPNRINVALSRARKGLLVVGNIYTLSYRAQNNPWQFVIAYLSSLQKPSLFCLNKQMKDYIDINFEIKQKRDTNKKIDVEMIFDPEDIDNFNPQYQNAIQKYCQQYEIQEQPFISSNYN